MAVSRKTRAARWGGALMVALAPLPWLGMGTAVANPGGQPGNADNVTICHRTNSVTNPYVVITVDPDAVDGNLGNDNGKGDHYLEHGGPVFDPTAEYPPPMSDDDWGDIIPPIQGVHDGLNWTAEGMAIYENDCKVPGPVTSSAPASSTKPVTTQPSTTKPVTTQPSTTKPVTTQPSTTKPPTTKPPTTKPPTSPSVTETQTTGSASPSTSSSSAAPSTSSSSAAPSTSISTQNSGSKPPKSSSPEVTETQTTAGALPKTGPDVPISGAVGISLLLIAVGALLLLGPGRLIPASYHRKH